MENVLYRKFPERKKEKQKKRKKKQFRSSRRIKSLTRNERVLIFLQMSGPTIFALH